MKKRLLYSLAAKVANLRSFTLALRSMVFSVSCVGVLVGNAWSDGIPVVLVEGNEIELSNFYLYYLPSSVVVAPGEHPLARRTDRPPQLRVTGGGSERPPSIFGSVTAGSAASFNSALNLYDFR